MSVELHTAKWVPGRSVQALYDPVSAVSYAQPFEDAEAEVLRSLQLQAMLLGATDVIAVELEWDWFAQRPSVQGWGSPVQTVAL